MSFLVLASLVDASQAARFFALLSGAATVLGTGQHAEISLLGTFVREARGKEETVCSALVTSPDGEPVAGGRARDLESVLKAMLSASGHADCEVRVFDGIQERKAEPADRQAP